MGNHEFIIIGTGFRAFGAILIGWMALTVHALVKREKRIDKRISRIIRREQSLGHLGIILLAIGFLIEVIGLT